MSRQHWLAAVGLLVIYALGFLVLREGLTARSDAAGAAAKSAEQRRAQ